MAKTITIHVDYSGGNDTTGDGSSGTPYQTYGKAVSVAVAGSVIGLGNNAAHILSTAVDWNTVSSPATAALPIVTTTWDNATTGDRAVIDCNGNAIGIWANADPYLVIDYLELRNNSGSNYILSMTDNYSTCSRCVMTDTVQGGVRTSSAANPRIIDNRITVVNTGLSAVNVQGQGSVVYGNILKHSAAQTTRIVYIVGTYTHCAHNIVHQLVSATGAGINLETGDFNVVTNNTIIGTSDSGTGLLVGSGSTTHVLTGNIIQDFATGVNYNSQQPAYCAYNVIYSCTAAEANVPASWAPDVAHITATDPLLTDPANGDYTIRESSMLAALYGMHINYGANQAFGTASGGGATAAAIADAVLEEVLADHSGVSGSLAERMTRIPNVAPAANGGLPTVDASNRIAGIVGTVVNTLDEIAGSTYVEGTHALDQVASTADLATTMFTTDSGQTYSTAVAGSAVKETATGGDFYWAMVDVRRDSSQDEYTVTWMNKNAVVSNASITSPTLQVVKRADGTDLIAQTALTQIGSTDYYKLDEAVNRLTLGEAAVAVVAATIGGSSRTWAVTVGRDVAT